MEKIKKYFWLLVMIMLFIIHLYIFIMELIPRTLYPVSITINYISLFLLIEVAIMTLFCLLKHNQSYAAIIVIHIILLIPAFIVFKIDISCSESFTNDVKTYLKFDEDSTSKEVSKYFPIEVNESDVENYNYFYEITDIIFYDGTNVEVCLKIKYDEQKYKLEIERLSDLYAESKLITFKYNNQYEEISFVDSIDYTYSTIRNGRVMKILFNEVEKSITYVYLKIEVKINTDKLYYFKNIVNSSVKK